MHIGHYATQSGFTCKPKWVKLVWGRKGILPSIFREGLLCFYHLSSLWLLHSTFLPRRGFLVHQLCREPGFGDCTQNENCISDNRTMHDQSWSFVPFKLLDSHLSMICNVLIMLKIPEFCFLLFYC